MLLYKVPKTDFFFGLGNLLSLLKKKQKEKETNGKNPKAYEHDYIIEYYLCNGPKFASHALDHWRGAPRSVSTEHKHIRPPHTLDINQLWQHSPIGYISPFHPIRFIIKAPVEIPQTTRYYLYCSVIPNPTPTLHYPHTCTTLIKPHSLNTHYRLVKTFLVNDSR